MSLKFLLAATLVFVLPVASPAGNTGFDTSLQVSWSCEKVLLEATCLQSGKVRYYVQDIEDDRISSVFREVSVALNRSQMKNSVGKELTVHIYKNSSGAVGVTLVHSPNLPGFVPWSPRLGTLLERSTILVGKGVKFSPEWIAKAVQVALLSGFSPYLEVRK
jgi:hypothetical protein